MKTIERKCHTSYRVPGYKGMGFMWNNGNRIGASVEHKQFLPQGAKQDPTHDSYWMIKNPTPAQVEQFLNTMKAKT